MSHVAVTQVFFVDGDDGATKAFEIRSPAVPRAGELVQLGPYGGPYEWRRVIEVTWRHEPARHGGTSVAILLHSVPVGQAARESGRGGVDAGRQAQRPRRKEDARQQRLIGDGD